MSVKMSVVMWVFVRVSRTMTPMERLMAQPIPEHGRATAEIRSKNPRQKSAAKIRGHGVYLGSSAC